jgi:hypothetical protein
MNLRLRRVKPILKVMILSHKAAYVCSYSESSTTHRTAVPRSKHRNLSSSITPLLFVRYAVLR